MTAGKVPILAEMAHAFFNAIADGSNGFILRESLLFRCPTLAGNSRRRCIHLGAVLASICSQSTMPAIAELEEPD
jgi:hypothetical protein